MSIIKKQNIFLVLYVFTGFFIYFLFFLLGNYTASDRSGYLNIFDLGYSNRLEVGFVALVNFLVYFFDSAIALNVYAVILYFTSIFFYYMVVKDWDADNYYRLDYFLILLVLFFSVFSVFSFAQIRAGLVVWIVMAALYFYQKYNFKRYLLIIALSSFFHYLALPVFLILLALRYFRLNLPIFFLAASVVLFWVSTYPLEILISLGLEESVARYYANYIIGDLRNEGLIFSPSVIFYLLISLFFLYFFLTDYIKTKIYPIATFFVLVSVFTDVDLFIKSISPILLLMSVVFIFKTKNSILNFMGFDLYYFSLFSIVGLSFTYSFLKWT